MKTDRRKGFIGMLAVGLAFALFCPGNTYAQDDTSATLQTIIAGIAYNQELIQDAKIACHFESGRHRKIGFCVFWMKGENFRFDETSTYEIATHLDPSVIQKFKNNKTYYYSPSGLQILDRNEGRLEICEVVLGPPVLPLSYGIGISISLGEGETKTNASIFTKRLKEGNLQLIGQETIEGNVCYLLESTSVGGSYIHRDWVCPDRGYTVLKQQMFWAPAPENPDGFEKRALMCERICTTGKWGDVWAVDEGAMRVYRPSKPNNLPMQLYRTEKITITSCEFNTGLKDTDFAAGPEEYRYIVDSGMGTGIWINPAYARED